MATHQSRCLFRAVVMTLAASLIALAVWPSSSHADPEPSIEEVEQKLEKLDERAAAATERYNAVLVTMRDIQGQVSRAQKSVDGQQKKIAALQSELGEYASLQFRMGGVDPALELMFADNPEDRLQASGLLTRMSAEQAAVLQAILDARGELDAKQEPLRAELTKLEAAKKEALAEKKEIDKAYAETEELLESLEAEERERLDDDSSSGGGGGAPTCPRATSRRSSTLPTRSLAAATATGPPGRTATTAPGSRWPRTSRQGCPYRARQARSPRGASASPPRPISSQATWSSTIRRSATSGSTSGAGRSSTRPTRAPTYGGPA